MDVSYCCDRISHYYDEYQCESCFDAKDQLEQLIFIYLKFLMILLKKSLQKNCLDNWISLEFDGVEERKS